MGIEKPHQPSAEMKDKKPELIICKASEYLAEQALKKMPFDRDIEIINQQDASDILARGSSIENLKRGFADNGNLIAKIDGKIYKIIRARQCNDGKNIAISIFYNKIGMIDVYTDIKYEGR